MSPSLASTFVLLAAAGVARGQIDFADAVHFPAGQTPAGGAALDYDLDGHLDVIVACRGDDELAFLRNHGDGTFAAPTTLALASDSNPEGVASGDFDHDGDVDLAVVLFGGEAVQLVLADGDGTFTPGTSFPLGSEPSMIVAVDLDDDGWLDVAINERGGGDVAVLINDQAGGFLPADFHDVGDETRDVAAGDLTGDGLPDLAVTSRDDRLVRVFENLGGGAFQFLIDLSYGSQLDPHGLGMADMDSDGWLDLYSVSRGSIFEAPQVVLRFNGGNPWVGPINGDYDGEGGAGVCHGDFDLDGIVDMATCNADSNDVSVMRNAGIGIFNKSVEYPVGSHPDCSEMLAVDLDLDGDADLVTFNEDSDDISVLINRHVVCQEDLGFGGPGDATLSICGDPLATGGSADLLLEGATPGVPALLAVSTSFAPTPFKGGMLVPLPFLLVLPFTTDGAGEIALADIPGGGGPLDVFVQFVLFDSTQPRGIALSNALRVELQP